jgi:hypothetical protein
MALELSLEAEAFLSQNNISGNIILEIDGFDFLFGSVKVTKVARYGDAITFGDGTLYGGSTEDVGSKDYVSLSGTTNNISQKLDQDKGGASSVTSFKIRLIDKDDELTRIFSPGITVADVLGREAVVYWQAQGSKHPVDSARLFVGVVASCAFGAGYCEVQIQHPETLKRQILLPKATTELTVAMTDSATLAFADDVTGFVEPSNNNELETYIRINDEIMKVSNIVNNEFLISERGALNTVAQSHGIGDEIESFYKLSGGPIDLALKMMLSDPTAAQEEFATATASRIVRVDATTSVPGAVFFDGIDVQEKFGLTVGDQAALTVGASVGNLFSYRNILSFGSNSSGSWIVVDQALTEEIDLSATILFKSKYNVLGTFGAGKNIKAYHVDIAQFESLQETFSAQFFSYEHYIKDDLNLADFIASQLFYPSGLFSLPRAGRISVGISAPPIVGPKAKTINADNVTNATSLKMTRSINNAFYNAIAYKFNDDSIDDRFLSAVITQSADSTNRINIGNRVLEIECGGIRESEANRNKIEAISSRFLDRYQYGAETVEVGVNFKTGFAIEPGDTVIFDGASLGVSDITQGNRDFLPRVFECIDKQINLRTGECKIIIQDTNLGVRARYGTWAPASLVGSGSTASNIVVKKSFGTEDFELERDKWADYILSDIRVRSDDHSTSERTTLIGLSATRPNVLIVNPPLSFTPTENMIIEPPVYDESDARELKLYKAIHCFWNPQVAATGGNTTSFTVDSGDIGKFYVGAPLQIHLADYSENASATVESISGTTVNLTTELGFSVTSSHLIDKIGFAGDTGSFYAFY